MKQESFSSMEYSCRKNKTKWEEFLEIMDEIIPWDEWVSLIVPHYPAWKRGRPPIEIENMMRMYLLQCWFNLSDYNGPRNSDHSWQKDREHGRISKSTERGSEPWHEQCTARSSKQNWYWR